MTTAIKQNKGKTLHGKVVSVKMKDTVVVAVSRLVKHPKYGKFLRTTKHFKAHDAGNTKKEGEEITIVECRPMSKDKHFRVVTSS